MQERIERLKKWAEGKPQPPMGIELAPTLRCNLNCKFCWRRNKSFNKTDKEMKEKEMSLERYREIILVPVLSNENFRKAPEMIELAKNYSIDRVEFKPLVTHGIPKLEKYIISEEKRKELQPRIEKSKKWPVNMISEPI